VKPITIHSLITARILYDEAKGLIDSSDRHMCSAGLLLLQDALEIIFLTLLTERDVDEQKRLESKSFDELIGELRKSGVKVPKSGTLKALNKQRVITKHYAQLAEPVTVRNYADAAEMVIESVVPQVLGKTLHEIFLSDFLEDGESKDFLNNATMLIQGEKYLEALIEIRKAIFVEIENEYAIHRWEDMEQGKTGFGLLAFGKGGLKAPYWTRNKEWIEKHVKEPIDYVQVDHERLRLDAMEWGLNTAELENLRRLTPDVFRSEKDAEWHIKYNIEFPPNEATNENAKYCLDRAISILLRKQEHARAKRWPQREVPFNPPPVYIGAAVYSKASRENEGYEYLVYRKVSGFDSSEQYYYISGSRPNPEKVLGRDRVSGYLLVLE